MEQQNNDQYEKWADEELQKIADQYKEIYRQTSNDMLVYGEYMVHINEDNTVTRIEPYSEEYWKIKKNKNNENS